jgi:hypothetical protein
MRPAEGGAHPCLIRRIRVLEEGWCAVDISAAAFVVMASAVGHHFKAQPPRVDDEHGGSEARLG